MTIRVFVLDDHDLVREGLRAVLERETDITVVGEAASVEETIGRLAPAQPDVVLVDQMLPDGSGLELCRVIRDRLPDAVCLVLTTVDNDDAITAAIRGDAAGFLPKRSSAAEIVRSIRVVADGGSLLDPSLTARLLDRLRTGRIADPVNPLLDRLSPQERRLLDLLGEGLTNRQIAQRMELAEKTVKNYVSNLLRKLDMRSRTEAAVYVTNLRAEQAAGQASGGTATIV